jgi:hypothetical protein
MGFISNNPDTLGNYTDKKVEYINVQDVLIESIHDKGALESLYEKRKNLKSDLVIKES